MRLLVSLAAACGLAGSAAAQTPELAAARLGEFIDSLDYIGPGYAVVVVTEDEIVLNHVEGLRRASTGAPLTTDTPMYIASQTKAYMGLLAARLDAKPLAERGRAPMHAGNGAGLTDRDLGDKDGSETVTLNMTQMPKHRHAWQASDGTANTASPDGQVFAEPFRNENATRLNRRRPRIGCFFG